MSKIFEFIPGSYVDKVNEKAAWSVSNTKIERTEKGLAIKNDGNMNITFPFQLNKSIFTITGSFKIKGNSLSGSANGIFGSIFALNNGIYFYVDNSTQYFWAVFNNSDLASTKIELNEWYHYIYISTGSELKLYLNGELVDSLVASEFFAAPSITKFGNACYTATHYLNGYIGKHTIYDTALNSGELAKIYQEFVNASPTSKNVEENILLPKPKDLSYLQDTGLVAAYNMKPVNGTIVDISGNGYDLIVGRGYSSSIDGLESFSNATGLNGDLINLTGDFTLVINFVIYNNTGLTSNLSMIFNNSNSHYVAINNLIGIRFYNGIGGAVSMGFLTPLSLGKSYNIVFTRSGSVLKLYLNGVYQGTLNYNSSALGVGDIGYSGYVAKKLIKEARIYDREWTEQEAIDYDNSFKKIEYSNKISDFGVGQTI